jgi:hypothetical protein
MRKYSVCSSFYDNLSKLYDETYSSPINNQNLEMTKLVDKLFFIENIMDSFTNILTIFFLKNKLIIYK